MVHNTRVKDLRTSFGRLLLSIAVIGFPLVPANAADPDYYEPVTPEGEAERVCPSHADATWPIDISQLEAAINKAAACFPPDITSTAIVAVIDNGIDPAEETRLASMRADFCTRGAVASEPTRFPYQINREEFCYAEQHNDPDGNDYPDDVIGTNLAKRAGFPAAYKPREHFDHGTHVAGLITGRYATDARRILAPLLGPRIRLRILNALRVPSQPGEKTTLPIESPVYALQYALRENAAVANLSLGWRDDIPNITTTLTQVEQDGTLLIVAAAGNSGLNLSCDAPEGPTTPDCSQAYPSAYTYSFRHVIVSVGASRRDGGLEYFSNRSPRYVDLAAPGCGIESTSISSDSNAYSSQTYSGTSQAAALTSLGAALLYQMGMTSAVLRKLRLMESGDYQPTLENDVASSATLNIAKAVSLYHDVIEFKQPNELYYTELADQTVDYCGAEKDIRRFSKITPLPSSQIRFGMKISNKTEFMAKTCASATARLRVRSAGPLPPSCAPVAGGPALFDCELRAIKDVVLRSRPCGH